MTTKAVSQKQIDNIMKFASVLPILNITTEDAVKDTWRASGVLGRLLDPRAEVIGALKELNARPFYARSSREAEMQLEVLRSLRSMEKDGINHPGIDALKKYFVKRETA